MKKNNRQAGKSADLLQGYSRAQLLTWLGEGSKVSAGWDAYLFLSRSKSNQLLVQEYVKRLGENNYLPSVTENDVIGTENYQFLRDFTLGNPLLSFENANIELPMARLTMPFVRGVYLEVNYPTGDDQRFITYSKVVPLASPRLTMELNLLQAPGSVSNSNQVMLDVSAGRDFTVDYVLGSTKQAIAGQYFLDKFLEIKETKPEILKLPLGEIDVSGGGTLVPKMFSLRTMAAPDATRRDAANYGDGAVLALINTTNTTPGGTPDGGLRYLLPNDTNNQGQLLYTAALLIKQNSIWSKSIKEMLVAQLGGGLQFNDAVPNKLVATAGSKAVTALRIPETHGYIIWYIDIPSISFPFNPGAITDSLTVQASTGESLRMTWKTMATAPADGEWRNSLDPTQGGRASFNVTCQYEMTATLVPSLRANGSGVTFDVVVDRADVSVTYSRGDIPTDGGTNFLRNAISRTLTDAIQGILLPGVSTLALQSLLFNGGNNIKLLSAHLPADLALFGDVSPELTSFQIVPDGAAHAKDGLYFVTAGATQKFTTIPARNDLTWSVSVVPGDAGQPGSVSGGLFTAPAAGQLGGPSSRTILTARAGNLNSSVAINILAGQLAIEPLVALVGSSQALPQIFSAQSMTGAELGWSIVGGRPNSRLEGVEGSTDQNFFASHDDAPPLSEQRLILHEIKVQDRQGGSTALSASAFALVSYGSLEYTLLPDPSPEAPALPDGQTQLVALRDGNKSLTAQFEILQGPGSITPAGLYTEDPAAEQTYVLIAARLFIQDPEGSVWDKWREGYNIFPLPLSDYTDIWERPAPPTQQPVPGVVFGPGPAAPQASSSTEPVAQAANGRDLLLQQMQGRSVTHGWSAISICNRTRINRLLEQQYISKLNANSFMPTMRGTVYMNASGTESAELSAIILGTPRLSFENASLTSSRARLTMDIMSGAIAHIGRSVGATPRLYSTLEIAPAQGYELYMDIDLQGVRGNIDEHSRVTLDLAQGTSFSTNLIGDPGMAAKLGEFFKQQFERLPPQSRIYELGLLDMVPADSFSPVDFRVRTQAAPGSQLAAADTYGDGAVVLFIRTHGDEFNGEMPATMPYWIPDDLGADGASKYSATLLVSNRALLHWPLAEYVEQTIPGLVMRRVKAPIGELNQVYAAQGSLSAPAIVLSWQNAGETNGHTFHSATRIPMPLAGASAAQSLHFTTGADGLLYLNWSVHFVHAFNHVFIKNGTGGGIDDWYNVTVAANLRMGFKASIDPENGEVVFERQSLSNDPVITIDGSFDHLTADEVLSRLRDPIARRIEAVFERQKITLPSINTLALQNILFPEGHAMELDEAFTPGDLVMFGNVNPGLTQATVSPQFHLMRAGATQQFALATDLRGATEVSWSCHSLDATRAQGVIDSDTGVYTALSPRAMEGRATRTVIKALFTDGGGERRAVSALVTEVAEGTQMAQGVVERQMTASGPIQLRAGTLGNGALTWRLLDQQLGTLVANGNEAVYTPPAQQAEPFTVQRIEVRNAAENEVSVCSVVLVSRSASIEVEPMYRPLVGPGRQVQLSVYAPPSRERRWRVLAGEGSVDGQGLFTAPASVEGSHAVVQCQVMDLDGELDYQGYSVLQVVPYAELSPWTSIAEFSVTPLTGAPILYRNGYQQLPVEIMIRTHPVDGQAAPPSPTDMLTVRLVYEDTSQVGFITDDGLEDPTNQGLWAVSEKTNGYDYYPAGNRADDEQALKQARLIDDQVLMGWREVDENTRSKIVYLHSTDALQRTFGAMILQDEVVPFYSKNFGGLENGSLIRVRTDVMLPQPNENYEVTATRVRGDGKCEYPDYDIYLSTLDYHNIQLRGSATHMIHFRDVKFESFVDRDGTLQPGGTSVQWEGAYLEETVACFLGYLLPQRPKAIFNQSFMRLSGMELQAEKFEVPVPGSTPTTGSLTIVMGRVRDLVHGPYKEYGSDEQRLLHGFNKRECHARIRDVNGNLHRLRISFATPENRNELKVEVDAPASAARAPRA